MHVVVSMLTWLYLQEADFALPGFALIQSRFEVVDYMAPFWYEQHGFLVHVEEENRLLSFLRPFEVCDASFVQEVNLSGLRITHFVQISVSSYKSLQWVQHQSTCVRWFQLRIWLAVLGTVFGAAVVFSIMEQRMLLLRCFPCSLSKFLLQICQAEYMHFYGHLVHQGGCNSLSFSSIVDCCLISLPLRNQTVHISKMWRPFQEPLHFRPGQRRGFCCPATFSQPSRCQLFTPETSWHPRR